MNYLVIPDSFKETMSSQQVCEIMKKVILHHDSAGKVTTIPIADGGEGTVDCMLYALTGEKITLETTGPFGDMVMASYAFFPGEEVPTAVFEMAATAGITLAEGRLDPVHATTYGLGTLVRDALKRGCRHLVFGLGGSCTNDGGTGLARALGTRFFRKTESEAVLEEFIPTSDEFHQIVYIDNRETAELLKGCRIEAMCDIDNPMFGPQGAAYMFAPQKGASEKTVQILDKELQALSEALEKNLGKQVAAIPGSGAAGAMGAGIVAFLGGELKPGIQTILDLVEFEEKLDGADYVFTGEGKIDRQSAHGKVISGVARRVAGRSVSYERGEGLSPRLTMQHIDLDPRLTILHTGVKPVPVIAVVGARGEGAEEIYTQGVTAIFPTCLEARTFEEMRDDAQIYLEKTMDSIMRLIKSMKD